MPTVAKKWFRQTDNLTLDQARKLLTQSFGIGLADTLENLDWDGKPIAAVGIELGPDNRKIIRSRFLLAGPLTKEPVTLQANKLFPEADPAITLTVTIPDGATFRFNDGTTTSDTLPCEAYKHHFTKNNAVIFPTDWPANKIGETSMRAVCHLDKNSSTGTGPRPKTTILIFHKSAEEMVQLSDSTQNPAWPGLRILQISHEFFPKIEEWRDPIPPLILPGSHFSEAPCLPSCKDMQFHIAAVMGSARLPTVCNTNKGLMKQWSKAIEDVEQLEKLPLITWPEVARPTAPTGELYVYFAVSISNKLLTRTT
jgi:hypothetical protein